MTEKDERFETIRELTNEWWSDIESDPESVPALDALDEALASIQAELSALREERDAALAEEARGQAEWRRLGRELEEARELLSGPTGLDNVTQPWHMDAWNQRAAAFLARTALSGEGERP